ncbi:MFS transporter [Altererythrobacter sp. GH1-8]|uniref:MFS transporter n=1 Tax=Altererythrobacter sp. GH1-8 TaxID=3349333 RepID=UPI00374DF6AE
MTSAKATAPTSSVLPEETSNAGAATSPKSAIIGWGIGSLGIALLYNTTSMLMLRYLVDYIGIAAGLASTLIAVSKVYDTVTDPMMGVITDRTKSRMGRRRPWLFLGAILSALALPILFMDVPFTGTALIVWVLFGLIWYATAYTVFSVPYMTMPAEMSDDPHERSEIFSWRVKAIAVGQLAAGAGGPALIVYFGGGQTGHIMMATVLGVLILISMMICFFMTRTARSLPMTVVKHSTLKEQARSLLADRNLTWLLSAKMMHLIAVAFGASSMAFYTMRVLQVPDTYLSLIIGSATAGILVATPVLTRISKRIGKQATYSLSVAIYVCANMAWYFCEIGLPAWVYVAIGFTSGVAGAGMMLIAQSLLSDIMADDRARNGYSREGVYAGFYTTVEKLSYAIGIVLVGTLLQAFGYIEGGGMDIVQPDSAIYAIRLSASVAPASFAILAAIMMTQVKPENLSRREEG